MTFFSIACAGCLQRSEPVTGLLVRIDPRAAAVAEDLHLGKIELRPSRARLMRGKSESLFWGLVTDGSIASNVGFLLNTAG